MEATHYKVDYMRDLMISGLLVMCCNNLSIFGAVGDGVVPDGSTSTIVPFNDPMQNIEIQIATPNSNGTSWNNYTHFNVPAPGVTLNNAPGASIIVNNVTSANTTTWLGELSILGDKAHVIVSNPNGILIDGGRGVNMSSLVVTTGSVSNIGHPSTIVDKLSIDTSQGLIDIGNGGLGGVFNSLNLLSKELRVHGPVTNESNLPGGIVQVVTGDSTIETNEFADPNSVGAELINNIPIAASGGVPSTELVVNLDQLGGITSSRISVVVTDQGAGVNVNNGQISASSDFRITADGRLVMNDMSIIAEEVNLRTASDTEMKNVSIEASGDIDLSSDGIMLTDSQVEGLGYLTIQAGDMSLDNTSVNIGLDSVVTADSLSLSNNSAWQSDNQILNIVGNLATDAGRIRGLSSVDIEAATINQTNQGYITSNGIMDLSVTGSISNDNSFMISEGDLSITSDSLTQNNNSEISSNANMSLDITNAINNEASDIKADQELDISAARLTNSNESLIISENTNTTLNITGDINNAQSRINAESELIINASNLTNTSEGLIESDTSNIDLNLANNLRNEGGVIFAANNINIDAADIINDYTNNQRAEIIAEGGKLAIQANNLTNNSSLLEGERLTINLTGNLQNNYTEEGGAGVIFAEGDGEQIDINTGGSIENYASRIISNGGLNLDANGPIRNYVRLTNNGQNTLERGSYKVHRSYFGIKIGKKIRSIREIFPNLESVDELPYLVSNGDMNIASDEEFENIGGEIIVNGSGNLAINTANVLNQNVRTGELYFEKQSRWWKRRVSGYSSVQSFGGNVNVAGDTTITATNDFINNGGIVYTEGDLNITANQVTNIPTTLYGTYHLHPGLKFWESRGHRLYGYSEGGFLSGGSSTNINSVQPVVSATRTISQPFEDQIGLFEDIFDSLGLDF